MAIRSPRGTSAAVPVARKPLSRRVLEWATPRVRDRWHPLRLAGVAAADTFVPAMPSKTLLIGSAAVAPERWLRFGLWAGFGNGLGGTLLAGALSLGVAAFGGSLEVAPGGFFAGVQEFVRQYGVWALFLLASVPWAHRTLVILSFLAGLSVLDIGAAMLCGRPIAFAALALAASRLPAGRLRCPWPHEPVDGAPQAAETPFRNGAGTAATPRR
jgi:hypothetical protein